MDEKEAAVKARLDGLLASILCSGCWPLHGCETAYYVDEESYVLEVWPLGIQEQDRPEGNGYVRTDKGVLYEMAEFDFSELVKSVAVEHFHFSQDRAVFEIGWKEFGHDVELRVHIEPQEDGGDSSSESG